LLLVGYLVGVILLNYIEIHSLVNARNVDVDAHTQNAAAVKMWTEPFELKKASYPQLIV